MSVILDGRWEVGQDDCRTGKRTDSLWRTSDTPGLALSIKIPHCSSTRWPLRGAARYSRTALPVRARFQPLGRLPSHRSDRFSRSIQEMPSASRRAPPRRKKWVRSGTADRSSNIRTRPTHANFRASLIRLRAAYMPDAARAGFRTTPELIPGTRRTPGFDITLGISTRHQRFAFARLSGSYLTRSSPAFCCNAHHHRF